MVVPGWAVVLGLVVLFMLIFLLLQARSKIRAKDLRIEALKGEQRALRRAAIWEYPTFSDWPKET